VFAVQVADLLGNGREVADEVAQKLILRDPPLLDGAYFLVSAYVPTVCAHGAPAVARRCFSRFKALRERLSGSILDSTDSFAEGARLWASGNGPAAAAEFRVLLGAPEPYVELLSMPMAQAFSSIDDEEAVALVAEKAEAVAYKLHGALPLHLFLARTAARKGDRQKACALSTRVVSAWSTADARVPSVAEARAIAAKNCPPG